MSTTVPRRRLRHFLSSGGWRGSGRLTLHGPRLGAISLRPRGQRTESAEWLKAVRGLHLRVFDTPEPRDGLPLVSILNHLDTYNQVFGVADTDLGVVGTLHRRTSAYGLDDAVWARYDVVGSDGADPGLERPSGNPWRVDPVSRGAPIKRAGLEALQRRGVVFIICQVSLATLASQLATRHGTDARAVFGELREAVLPGVVLVSCARTAIEQARRRGFRYRWLGGVRVRQPPPLCLRGPRPE